MRRSRFESRSGELGHSAGFLSNADDTTVRELIQVLRQTKTQFRPLPGFENTTVDVQDRLNAGVDCDEVIGEEGCESITRCCKVGRGKPVSLLLDAARWKEKTCEYITRCCKQQLCKIPLKLIPVDGGRLAGYSTGVRSGLPRVRWLRLKVGKAIVFSDSDYGAAQNKQYLKRLGVTHVLNTAEGNRFGMVNTNEGYYRDSGIKYMGVHLLDLPMTNIGAHFNETADFIEEAVKSGGNVMVHCLMGMSRSSTCVLAYLMIKEGLSAAESLKKVRTSRDIRPNDGFMRQLADLDNKLRRDRARALKL
uniref:protein-serine/threonine phosphatase n=1 Tax=Timema genevievae TaxID=629358 RepID=A0A7R9JYR5_TIMGE|nr:unnamed protein product [Timema genevievae]